MLASTPVAQALLPYLPLHGRIVTADALHTQTAFAQGVLDQGGDYLLCVKGNQPTLYADIALAAARAVPLASLDQNRAAPQAARLQPANGQAAFPSLNWPVEAPP